MVCVRTEKEIPPPAALQRTGWTFDLVVEGQSMEPLLHAGDVVTVACVPPEKCLPGDLICFRESDSFFLHRLLEVRADGRLLYEKGDAEAGGHWLDGDLLLGRAERINGEPLDAAFQERALRMSRCEVVFSRALRCMGLAPALAGLKTQWRKLKMKCLGER